MRLNKNVAVVSSGARRTKRLVAYTIETRRTLLANVAVCYVASLRKQLIPLPKSPSAPSRHRPHNSPTRTSGTVETVHSLCPGILSKAFAKSTSEFSRDSPMFELCLHVKFQAWLTNKILCAFFAYRLTSAFRWESAAASPRLCWRLLWAFRECRQPTRLYSWGIRPHDRPARNLMTDNIKRAVRNEI